MNADRTRTDQVKDDHPASGCHSNVTTWITSVIAVALFAGGCSGEESSPPAPPPPPVTTTETTVAEPLYALQPTLRCIKRRATLMTAPADDRLRALRDLAQRTSALVRFQRQEVGIAVVESEAHAKLLADLLVAPDDPYRIVLRRNAVLLFLPRARVAFRFAAGCLRSSR